MLRDIALMGQMMPPPDPDREEAAPPGRPRAAPPGDPPRRVVVTARQLNSEAIHLRRRAEEIQRGEVTLADYAELFEASYADMDGMVEALDGEEDAITNLRNIWEVFGTIPVFTEPLAERDAKAEREGLSRLIRACREVTLATMRLTVTDRLSDWLERMAGEYVLDFHATFRDEVLDREDRSELLRWLAAAPNTFTSRGGIIEPDTGLVYKTVTDPGKRRARELLLFGLLLVSLGMVWLTGALDVLNAAIPTSVDEQASGVLVIGWLAALVGFFIHVLIGAAKRMREGVLGGAFPLDRARMLLTARTGAIAVRFLSIFVAYYGLVFALGVPSDEGGTAFLFNALLVGYSADSVLEVLTGTLDSRAKVLRGRLGSPEE